MDNLPARKVKAIALVGKEYTEDKYSSLAEFEADIPGFKTYEIC